MSLASVRSEESFQERQDSEIEVLKAIYMDDVTDMRDLDKWKVKRAPELMVTLHPQESMHGNAAHVGCKLWLKCPWNYPEQVPELKIKEEKGLSKHQVGELEKDLLKLATSFIGEVMIHELCQHVQTFLHAHNRPPAPSFYEVMMTNKQKLQEKLEKEQQHKAHARMIKEEKELLEAEEEIKKRKDEAKKRKEAQQVCDHFNSKLCHNWIHISVL